MLRSSFLATALLAVPAAASAQATTTTIKVGVIPSEVCGQIFYGIDQGFFKQHGLDVQLQRFSNGPAIAAGVASGSLDVGLADLASAIAAHARGVPIVYLAPGLIYSDKAPTFAIIVPHDSPIHDAAELRGAFASSGLGNIAQLATEAWIERNGGKLANVQFVEMPPAVVPDALTTGKIQAGTANEPWLTSAERKGFRVIYMTNGMAPAYLLSGWVASKRWAERNPATVAKFVGAVAEASAWANAHHGATAPILAKYTKIPASVIARMHRGNFAEHWNDALVQPEIEAAVHFGRIKKPFPASELFYSAR